MKIKYIIYTLLILCLTGVSVISCIDDDDAIDTPPPAGQAFFSLDVDMGVLPEVTRSGDEQGTANELKIHNVRVVLYNGNESAGTADVKYVFDMDIKTPTSWSGASASGWVEGTDLNNASQSGKTLKFSTKPRLVADQPYRMLVLVNGKGISSIGQKSLYDITNIGCFQYQLDEVANIEVNPLTGTVTGGTGLFMSNHQGLVEVANTQLGKSSSEAAKSPVRVSVDRLVAKVMVKHASKLQLPDGVDGASATWGLAVVNKKSFWMREMTDGETKQNGLASMGNLYAKDPNNSLVGSTVADAHFKKVLFLDNGAVRLAANSFNKKMEDYEYVTENTISDSKYVQQATHVVVSYNYRPEGYSKGQSFYIYDNQIISVNDMKSYSSNGAIPNELSGLRDAIDKIPVRDKDKYPLNGTGTFYFEINGITFCPGGMICFYFPIRHFDTKDKNTLGYYGVVRNNIYEITINGMEIPENTDRYLSANICVQPWAMREQKSDIGITVRERKWMPVKIHHYLNYNEVNLYWLWSNKRYTYQTILATVGSQITGTLYHMQDRFDADMPDYRGLKYAYSVPFQGIVVSENSVNNEIQLVYSLQYVEVVFFHREVKICFIDKDCNILSISGIDINNKPISSNPLECELPFVLANNPYDKSFVYLTHLQKSYNLTISRNGVRYEIASPSACAVHYSVNANRNPVNGKLSVAGDTSSPMGEPVEIANKQGTLLPDKGIAIICVPK